MDLISGVFFLIVGYRDPIYRSLDIQMPAVIQQFNNRYSCEQFRNQRREIVINHIKNLAKNDNYLSYFREFFYFDCVDRIGANRVEIIENKNEAVQHINNIHRVLLSKYRAYNIFNNNRKR